MRRRRRKQNKNIGVRTLERGVGPVFVSLMVDVAEAVPLPHEFVLFCCRGEESRFLAGLHLFGLAAAVLSALTSRVGHGARSIFAPGVAGRGTSAESTRVHHVELKFLLLIFMLLLLLLLLVGGERGSNLHLASSLNFWSVREYTGTL
jgi:hypothetical protein